MNQLGYSKESSGSKSLKQIEETLATLQRLLSTIDTATGYKEFELLLFLSHFFL